MKTPRNVLLTAIAYWFVVFAITRVPAYSKNYYVNLALADGCHNTE